MKVVVSKTIKVDKPIPQELKQLIESKNEWKNKVRSGELKPSKNTTTRFL